MSLKFDCHGKGEWSLRISVDILEGNINNSLFDKEYWKLEKYIDEVWQDSPDNEAIDTIRLSADSGLDFTFTHLGGLYRLECLYSTVDDDYKYVYFAQYASGRDPYYIVMEGLDFNGSNIIPSMYFNGLSLPSSLSQQLNLHSGISTSGSMEISLVDIEGKLTRAFRFRINSGPINKLSEDIDASDTTICTDDNEGFHDSGFVYIDNEAIYYAGKDASGNFTDCVRGSLNTRASNHQKDKYVTDHSCYFQGRHIWVKKPSGPDYNEDDEVLFSGTIETLQPSSSNLSCYTLVINDPMVYLSCNVGQNMASARLLPQLYISGEETGYGRRGNDVLYLRRLKSVLDGYENLEIKIPQGFYLTDYKTQDSDNNITTYLENAINAYWPTAHCSMIIDENQKVTISFRINYIIEIMDSGVNKVNKDSILQTLGFNDQKLKFSNISAFGTGSVVPDTVSITAESSIRNGTGAYNRKIYIEDNYLNYNVIEKFKKGNLVRIEDELIYYDGIVIPDTNNITTSVLSVAIDDDNPCITLDHVIGFPDNGAIIKIDNEIIYYNKILAPNSLGECDRGIWGTIAASHAELSEVTLIELPYLYDCVRGAYNTIASVHGSARIIQIVTSDILSQLVAGQLDAKESTAGEFVLNLLDPEWSDFGFSADIPDGVVNHDSFLELSDFNTYNFDGTFLRLIYPDESYRDVIADICKSLNIYLYINKDGKISLGYIKPLLKHASKTVKIGQGEFIKAPQISWKEDMRVSRTEFYLDYDSIDEDYNTTVILEDQSLPHSPLVSENGLTFELESKCIQTRNMANSTGGEGFYYDYAWSLIKQFNAPLTEVRISVLPSIAQDIELLSLIELNTDILPIGDGNRGIDSGFFQVVEIENNLAENEINLTLLERGTTEYGGISPCLEILEFNNTTSIVTVARNQYWDNDLDPSLIFKDGINLRIKYISQLEMGYFQSSETLTIATGGSDFTNWNEGGVGYLTFNLPPTSNPSSGDLLISVSYGINDGEEIEKFVFLADAEENLNSTDEPYYYSY